MSWRKFIYALGKCSRGSIARSVIKGERLKGRTRFPIAIYPRNSNRKSMISVPLPMQKVVKNSWCGASLVGLVLKSYVTNGTLVYVLLSKKNHGRIHRSAPKVGDCRCSAHTMWRLLHVIKNSREKCLARVGDLFEIPSCVGMTNQSITLHIPFCHR